MAESLIRAGRFRDFQWTRLRLEETPVQFGARVQALLAGEEAPTSGRPSGMSVPPMLHAHGQDAHATSARAGRRVPAAAWGAAILAVVFALGLAWWSKNKPSPNARRATPQSATEKTKTDAPPPASNSSNGPALSLSNGPALSLSKGLTEARQLAAKARALYEPWDGATRQDFTLAEELLKRAVTLDPADAEVWAAYALLTCGQILLGFDRSPARIENARTFAERATKLAPDSRQARFAQASAFRFQTSMHPEAERMLQELVAQGPDDGLMLRMHAAALRSLGKFDEALRILDRAAALPGGAPAAMFNKFIVLSAAQRHEEAEAVLDAAIAKNPTPYLYRAKVSTLTLLQGDLDAAAKVLEKIPGAYLLEDSGAYAASQLWLWRREGDKAVAVWRSFTRDLIECAEFRGPKAFLVGTAHHMAGRPTAAETEWRAALGIVERELATQPNAILWVYWRARLLASLGRKDEAAAGLKVFEELTSAKGLTNDSIPIYLLLGRKEEVIAALEKSRAALVAKGNPIKVKAQQNNFRFNHEWELIRDDPRVQALLKTPETKQ